MTRPAMLTVNEDVRGSISRITMPEAGTERKVNLLFTRAGVARSGDQHDDAVQYDMVLSGEWHIWCRQDGEDRMMVKREGDLFQIPPGVPHLFLCTKDSWMLEWWSKPMDWMMQHGVKYYPRYRKIVDRLASDPAYRADLPGDFREE